HVEEVCLPRYQTAVAGKLIAITKERDVRIGNKTGLLFHEAAQVGGEGSVFVERFGTSFHRSVGIEPGNKPYLLRPRYGLYREIGPSVSTRTCARRFLLNPCVLGHFSGFHRVRVNLQDFRRRRNMSLLGTGRQGKGHE